VSQRPAPTTVQRALGALAIVVGTFVGPVLINAGSVGTVQAAAPAPVTTNDPAVLASNPFIPEADLSDCNNSLPRPNCGSDQRSGYHQYLTLIILFLGTVFIAWRVARGVRARDRANEPPPKAPAPKEPAAPRSG
jgi:hypothetical protein